LDVAQVDRLADHAIVFVDDAGRPEERIAVRSWVRKFPMLNLASEKGMANVKKGF